MNTRTRTVSILAGLAVCLGLSAGCTVAKIQAAAPPTWEPVSQTSHRLFWGLICFETTIPYHVARAEVYLGIGDWFATVLTAGIYSPYSVDVWGVPVQQQLGATQAPQVTVINAEPAGSPQATTVQASSRR